MTNAALLLSAGAVAALLLHARQRRRRCRTALTTHEAIYIGSERVSISHVPGVVEPFTPTSWHVDFSEEGLKETARLSSRLTAPDSMRGADVVVPAVPSRRLKKRDAGAHCPSTPLLHEWPFPLHSPLLKVKRELPSVSVAVASGARSCLLRGADGRWYRLKGAGNRDQGVIVRHNQGGWRDLRGVAFDNTSLQELFWTERLRGRLEPQGLVCANRPLGRYLYDHPNAPFGLTRSLRPVCIVMATEGDRRLGTHVLAGLALLLPKLLRCEERMQSGGAEHPSEPCSLGPHSLAQSFPPLRPDPSKVTTAQLCSDYMLARELAWAGVGEADTHGLEWPDLPREPGTCFATYADVTTTATVVVGPLGEVGKAELRKGELNPHAPDPTEPPPVQWSAEGSAPMAEEWLPRWCEACVQLDAALRGVSEPQLALPYLYARLGHECGRFLRSLHAEGVSWGTYQDAMCHDSQWHCNAHSNNFVLLPRGWEPDETTSEHAAAILSAHPLLTYLDLDMAFDLETYVDLQTSAVDDGLQPDARAASAATRHAQLLEREAVNLCEVLAGGDASSGVPNVASKEVEAQPQSARIASTALHDVLVSAYLRAYNEGDSTVAFVPALEACAHALMQLAIIVMARCEA